MAIDDTDRLRLGRALQLAEQSIGLSEPNPRVGCVLADACGNVIGEGFTQRAGQAHAEIHALQSAARAGHSTVGGTAWVTLEPCAHHGKTPPCCEALVAAGLARVVVAVKDPFPKVDGAGIRYLRDAGLAVDLVDCTDSIASAAIELNVGFFSRMQRGRPWVRLKAAQSLDGRMALPNGCSKWITGLESRTDGHRWRKRAGGILTGIGTVLADQPRLDVRLVQTEVQPLRVVLDSTWKMPNDAVILQPPGDVLIVGLSSSSQRLQRLESSNVRTLELPGTGDSIDLHDLLDWLCRLGINELHVEAGPRLSSALLTAGLIDEILLYVAPILIGAGPSVFMHDGLNSPMDAPRWSVLRADRLGDDFRIVLRKADAPACKLTGGSGPETGGDSFCQIS